MTAHFVFPIDEPSQVGEARRAAARLTKELGFDEVPAGRAALVVTEMATNLAKHARGGRILLRAQPDANGGSLELLSLDEGPGMADVNSCLRDGFSSAGTQGTGLGAVKRQADMFSIFSMPAHGTVIGVRIAGQAGRSLAAGLSVGAAAIAAPGETVCGDAWSFGVGADGLGRLMVADGLGHGPSAAEAANEAIAVFEAHTADKPAQAIERAHARLRSTRGAAVAVAALDAAAGRIVFAGAGNIAGRIVSGVEDRSLLSQHGTVGFQIRTLQDIHYDWPAHALLVMHSDGIVSRWNFADAPGLLQCDPMVIAGWILRAHGRGRDDATVVVVRRR